MRGGVVCYLERAGGGSMIRRVRLVAAGMSRTWTAPEGSAVSSVGGEVGGEGAAVGAARSSAQWVAQSLESVGLKRLAAVCADADGSVCAWLSAPNPEPAVIEATIAQSGADADGTGAGIGAARLLAMTAGSGTGGDVGDVSLQALATLERTDEAPALKDRVRAGLMRRSPGTTGGRKSRYAVLAVPDAPLRVFMDELDALGIEVEAVMSLWHAMAAAWDPDLRKARTDDHLVSSDQPSSAVVLVEPAGRLVWAWTLAGELVAGGSMRLATVTRSNEPGAAKAGEGTLATTDTSGSARRVTPAAGESAEPSTMVEFSSADAGRLVMDWLAWSAQLGQCPQRVVCLACPKLGSSDGGGPESLARLVARVWPNATIDGAAHDDPVGATIGRLAGLGNDNDPVVVSAQDDDLPAAVRPRAALVGLSARPGRADRSLHRWIAAALVALAAVIGAAAFKVHQSVSGITGRIAAMQDSKKTVLQQLGAAINQPGFDQMLPAQQNDIIEGAIRGQRDLLNKLRAPRPVIEETVRFLTALSGGEGEDVKLIDFEVSPVAAVATLNVPDAGSGPAILERLNKLPGVLPWQGSTPPGARADGSRVYKLTAIWPENAVRTPPSPVKPGAAAKPADDPDPSAVPSLSPAAPEAMPAPESQSALPLGAKGTEHKGRAKAAKATT